MKSLKSVSVRSKSAPPEDGLPETDLPKATLSESERNLPEEAEKEYRWKKLADFFAILGDSTRLKILGELKNGEKNVSDLAEKVGASSSAVSHQLKTLKAHDLVRTRRKGKFIYYRISDLHVELIMQMGADHLSEQQGAAAPKKRRTTK